VLARTSLLANAWQDRTQLAEKLQKMIDILQSFLIVQLQEDAASLPTTRQFGAPDLFRAED
jgi:hypothetical protein